MVTPFAETPKEKKELALHMYHNGHSYRTLCKEVRLSPSTLSSYIKSEAGYIENSEGQFVNKSKESKALALYDKNKMPFEVAVELDITADKAVEYYEKFQRLKSIPLENTQNKLTQEIKQLESEKSKINSELTHLRDMVIKSHRMLNYYKTENERLLVLCCQKRQLLGW
jgi:hypothetical protein